MGIDQKILLGGEMVSPVKVRQRFFTTPGDQFNRSPATRFVPQ